MTKKLFLLVFSLCFILLSCEFVIRYRHQAWPFESALYVPDYLSTRDTTLRWRFSPSNGRNSLGLRNRELLAKKDGTFRILFLGDSLIWSGETSTGELYTTVLEQRLNSHPSSDSSSFEIINAGIPGYTTYQELEFLKIYGMDMKPDLVVLGFVFNDLYHKYLHRPTKKRLLTNEPAVYLFQFNPYSLPGVIFGRSYFAHRLVAGSKAVWKIISHRPIFPVERREDFYLAWKSYGWINARKLIGEMQALLRERDIPLVVLVFPVSDQVNDKYRKLDESYVLYPQGKIREICDTYAIPMLDLTESIHRNGGVTLFSDYLHLNTKGNDVVTDEIEKYLLEKLFL